MKNMKNTDNNKLLDLAEKLEIDSEYIDEALTGDSEKYGTKVYAGKSRVSPMKIVAPIAACLAVFTAAGILLANSDKLPIRNGNDILSTPDSTSSADSTANSPDENTESNKTESTDNSEPNILIDKTAELWGWGVPSQTDYADTCKGIVMSLFTDNLQGDITWQAGDIDIDYDLSYEIVLCPQMNGKSVKGVGACIFKKFSATSDPIYVGSFGSEFDMVDLDNLHLIADASNKSFYYFNNLEEFETCTDSIQRFGFDNGEVWENNYLRVVKTYPNDASSDTPYTETYYCNGNKIGYNELLSKWLNTPSYEHFKELPLPNISPDNSGSSHLGMTENIQLLIDKYNIPVTDINSLHRKIQYLDLNGDGYDEAVVEFRNCEYLRGMYVFSTDGRLIGEFDLEGERGNYQGILAIDTVCKRVNTEIFLYDDGEEKYYYYKTTHGGVEYYESGGCHEWGEGEINRIVVNANGTLGIEKAVEYSYKDGFNSMNSFFINGKAVSYTEYTNERFKILTNTVFPKRQNSGNEPYIW